MKNGLPGIYWSFRYAWSAMHVVLVLLLTSVLTMYLVRDGRGADLYDEAFFRLTDVSNQLASLVPFPWS